MDFMQACCQSVIECKHLDVSRVLTMELYKRLWLVSTVSNVISAIHLVRTYFLPYVLQMPESGTRHLIGSDGAQQET